MKKVKPLLRMTEPEDYLYALYSDLPIRNQSCPHSIGTQSRELTKDEYDALIGFRERARELSLEVASELEELISKSKNPKIHLLGVLGLARSPNCACYSAKLKEGESQEMEIFFEELIIELNKRGFSPHLVDINVKNVKKSLIDLDKLY